MEEWSSIRNKEGYGFLISKFKRKMPVIKLKLGEDSIIQAIKEIKAYKEKVVRLSTELVETLTKRGVEIAKMNVSDMKAYDSGELYDSIHSIVKGNIGYVIADAPHAAFVCFGTGIVGANTPHPDVAIAGWKYDVNNHGELGWWYIGKDGQPHWTKGMPSRPYMYQAAQLLRQIVVPAAKETLK